MLNNASVCVCVCGRYRWQRCTGSTVTGTGTCTTGTGRGPTLPNQFLMDVRKFMVKNIFDYAQWTRELVNCAKATEHRSDQHPCPLVWLAPTTQYPFPPPTLLTLAAPLLNCVRPTRCAPSELGVAIQNELYTIFLCTWTTTTTATTKTRTTGVEHNTFILLCIIFICCVFMTLGGVAVYAIAWYIWYPPTMKSRKILKYFQLMRKLRMA